MIRTNQGIERILSGPNSSGWSKTALLSALDREPIDAINDAEILQILWEDGLEVRDYELNAKNCHRN